MTKFNLTINKQTIKSSKIILHDNINSDQPIKGEFGVKVYDHSIIIGITSFHDLFLINKESRCYVIDIVICQRKNYIIVYHDDILDYIAPIDIEIDGDEFKMFIVDEDMSFMDQWDHFQVNKTLVIGYNLFRSHCDLNSNKGSMLGKQLDYCKARNVFESWHQEENYLYLNGVKVLYCSLEIYETVKNNYESALQKRRDQLPKFSGETDKNKIDNKIKELKEKKRMNQNEIEYQKGVSDERENDKAMEEYEKAIENEGIKVDDVHLNNETNTNEMFEQNQQSITNQKLDVPMPDHKTNDFMDIQENNLVNKNKDYVTEVVNDIQEREIVSNDRNEEKSNESVVASTNKSDEENDQKSINDSDEMINQICETFEHEGHNLSKNGNGYRKRKYKQKACPSMSVDEKIDFTYDMQHIINGKVKIEKAKNKKSQKKQRCKKDSKQYDQVTPVKFIRSQSVQKEVDYSNVNKFQVSSYTEFLNKIKENSLQYVEGAKFLYLNSIITISETVYNQQERNKKYKMFCNDLLNSKHLVPEKDNNDSLMDYSSTYMYARLIGRNVVNEDIQQYCNKFPSEVRKNIMQYYREGRWYNNYISTRYNVERCKDILYELHSISDPKKSTELIKELWSYGSTTFVQAQIECGYKSKRVHKMKKVFYVAKKHYEKVHKCKQQFKKYKEYKLSSDTVQKYRTEMDKFVNHKIHDNTEQYLSILYNDTHFCLENNQKIHLSSWTDTQISRLKTFAYHPQESENIKSKFIFLEKMHVPVDKPVIVDGKIYRNDGGSYNINRPRETLRTKEYLGQKKIKDNDEILTKINDALDKTIDWGDKAWQFFGTAIGKPTLPQFKWCLTSVTSRTLMKFFQMLTGVGASDVIADVESLELQIYVFSLIFFWSLLLIQTKMLVNFVKRFMSITKRIPNTNDKARTLQREYYNFWETNPICSDYWIGVVFNVCIWASSCVSYLPNAVFFINLCFTILFVAFYAFGHTSLLMKIIEWVIRVELITAITCKVDAKSIVERSDNKYIFNTDVLYSLILKTGVIGISVTIFGIIAFYIIKYSIKAWVNRKSKQNMNKFKLVSRNANYGKNVEAYIEEAKDSNSTILIEGTIPESYINTKSYVTGDYLITGVVSSLQLAKTILHNAAIAFFVGGMVMKVSGLYLTPGNQISFEYNGKHTFSYDNAYKVFKVSETCETAEVFVNMTVNQRCAGAVSWCSIDDCKFDRNTIYDSCEHEHTKIVDCFLQTKCVHTYYERAVIKREKILSGSDFYYMLQYTLDGNTINETVSSLNQVVNYGKFDMILSTLDHAERIVVNQEGYELHDVTCYHQTYNTPTQFVVIEGSVYGDYTKLCSKNGCRKHNYVRTKNYRTGRICEIKNEKIICPIKGELSMTINYMSGTKTATSTQIIYIEGFKSDTMNDTKVCVQLRSYYSGEIKIDNGNYEHVGSYACQYLSGTLSSNWLKVQTPDDTQMVYIDDIDNFNVSRYYEEFVKEQVEIEESVFWYIVGAIALLIVTVVTIIIIIVVRKCNRSSLISKHYQNIRNGLKTEGDGKCLYRCIATRPNMQFSYNNALGYIYVDLENNHASFGTERIEPILADTKAVCIDFNLQAHFTISYEDFKVPEKRWQVAMHNLGFDWMTIKQLLKNPGSWNYETLQLFEKHGKETITINLMDCSFISSDEFWVTIFEEQTGLKRTDAQNFNSDHQYIIQASVETSRLGFVVEGMNNSCYQVPYLFFPNERKVQERSSITVTEIYQKYLTIPNDLFDYSGYKCCINSPGHIKVWIPYEEEYRQNIPITFDGEYYLAYSLTQFKQWIIKNEHNEDLCKLVDSKKLFLSINSRYTRDFMSLLAWAKKGSTNKSKLPKSMVKKNELVKERSIFRYMPKKDSHDPGAYTDICEWYIDKEGTKIAVPSEWARLLGGKPFSDIQDKTNVKFLIPMTTVHLYKAMPLDELKFSRELTWYQATFNLSLDRVKEYKYFADYVNLLKRSKSLEAADILKKFEDVPTIKINIVDVKTSQVVSEEREAKWYDEYDGFKDVPAGYYVEYKFNECSKVPKNEVKKFEFKRAVEKAHLEPSKKCTLTKKQIEAINKQISEENKKKKCTGYEYYYNLCESNTKYIISRDGWIFCPTKNETVSFGNYVFNKRTVQLLKIWALSNPPVFEHRDKTYFSVSKMCACFDNCFNNLGNYFRLEKLNERIQQRISTITTVNITEDNINEFKCCILFMKMSDDLIIDMEAQELEVVGREPKEVQNNFFSTSGITDNISMINEIANSSTLVMKDGFHLEKVDYASFDCPCDFAKWTMQVMGPVDCQDLVSMNIILREECDIFINELYLPYYKLTQKGFGQLDKADNDGDGRCVFNAFFHTNFTNHVDGCSYVDLSNYIYHMHGISVLALRFNAKAQIFGNPNNDKWIFIGVEEHHVYAMTPRECSNCCAINKYLNQYVNGDHANDNSHIFEDEHEIQVNTTEAWVRHQFHLVDDQIVDGNNEEVRRVEWYKANTQLVNRGSDKRNLLSSILTTNQEATPFLDSRATVRIYQTEDFETPNRFSVWTLGPCILLSDEAYGTERFSIDDLLTNIKGWYVLGSAYVHHSWLQAINQELGLRDLPQRVQAFMNAIMNVDITNLEDIANHQHNLDEIFGQSDIEVDLIDKIVSASGLLQLPQYTQGDVLSMLIAANKNSRNALPGKSKHISDYLKVSNLGIVEGYQAIIGTTLIQYLINISSSINGYSFEGNMKKNNVAKCEGTSQCLDAQIIGSHITQYYPCDYEINYYNVKDTKILINCSDRIGCFNALYPTDSQEMFNTSKIINYACNVQIDEYNEGNGWRPMLFLNAGTFILNSYNYITPNTVHFRDYIPSWNFMKWYRPTQSGLANVHHKTQHVKNALLKRNVFLQGMKSATDFWYAEPSENSYWRDIIIIYATMANITVHIDNFNAVITRNASTDFLYFGDCVYYRDNVNSWGEQLWNKFQQIKDLRSPDSAERQQPTQLHLRKVYGNLYDSPFTMYDVHCNNTRVVSTSISGWLGFYYTRPIMDGNVPREGQRPFVAFTCNFSIGDPSPNFKYTHDINTIIVEEGNNQWRYNFKNMIKTINSTFPCKMMHAFVSNVNFYAVTSAETHLRKFVVYINDGIGKQINSQLMLKNVLNNFTRTTLTAQSLNLTIEDALQLDYSSRVYLAHQLVQGYGYQSQCIGNLQQLFVDCGFRAEAVSIFTQSISTTSYLQQLATILASFCNSWFVDKVICTLFVFFVSDTPEERDICQKVNLVKAFIGDTQRLTYYELKVYVLFGTFIWAKHGWDEFWTKIKQLFTWCLDFLRRIFKFANIDPQIRTEIANYREEDLPLKIPSCIEFYWKVKREDKDFLKERYPQELNMYERYVLFVMSHPKEEDINRFAKYDFSSASITEWAAGYVPDREDFFATQVNTPTSLDNLLGPHNPISKLKHQFSNFNFLINQKGDNELDTPMKVYCMANEELLSIGNSFSVDYVITNHPGIEHFSGYRQFGGKKVIGLGESGFLVLTTTNSIWTNNYPSTVVGDNTHQYAPIFETPGTYMITGNKIALKGNNDFLYQVMDYLNFKGHELDYIRNRYNDRGIRLLHTSYGLIKYNNVDSFLHGYNINQKCSIDCADHVEQKVCEKLKELFKLYNKDELTPLELLVRPTFLHKFANDLYQLKSNEVVVKMKEVGIYYMVNWLSFKPVHCGLISTLLGVNLIPITEIHDQVVEEYYQEHFNGVGMIYLTRTNPHDSDKWVKYYIPKECIRFDYYRLNVQGFIYHKKPNKKRLRGHISPADMTLEMVINKYSNIYIAVYNKKEEFETLLYVSATTYHCANQDLNMIGLTNIEINDPMASHQYTIKKYMGEYSAVERTPPQCDMIFTLDLHIPRVIGTDHKTIAIHEDGTLMVSLCPELHVQLTQFLNDSPHLENVTICPRQHRFPLNYHGRLSYHIGNLEVTTAIVVDGMFPTVDNKYCNIRTHRQPYNGLGAIGSTNTICPIWDLCTYDTLLASLLYYDYLDNEDKKAASRFISLMCRCVGYENTKVIKQWLHQKRLGELVLFEEGEDTELTTVLDNTYGIDVTFTNLAVYLASLVTQPFVEWKDYTIEYANDFTVHAEKVWRYLEAKNQGQISKLDKIDVAIRAAFGHFAEHPLVLGDRWTYSNPDSIPQSVAKRLLHAFSRTYTWFTSMFTKPVNGQFKLTIEDSGVMIDNGLDALSFITSTISRYATQDIFTISEEKTHKYRCEYFMNSRLVAMLLLRYNTRPFTDNVLYYTLVILLILRPRNANSIIKIMTKRITKDDARSVSSLAKVVLYKEHAIALAASTYVKVNETDLNQFINGHVSEILNLLITITNIDNIAHGEQNLPNDIIDLVNVTTELFKSRTSRNKVQAKYRVNDFNGKQEVLTLLNSANSLELPNSDALYATLIQCMATYSADLQQIQINKNAVYIAQDQFYQIVGNRQDVTTKDNQLEFVLFNGDYHKVEKKQLEENNNKSTAKSLNVQNNLDMIVEDEKAEYVDESVVLNENKEGNSQFQLAGMIEPQPVMKMVAPQGLQFEDPFAVPLPDPMKSPNQVQSHADNNFKFTAPLMPQPHFPPKRPAPQPTPQLKLPQQVSIPKPIMPPKMPNFGPIPMPIPTPTNLVPKPIMPNQHIQPLKNDQVDVQQKELKMLTLKQFPAPTNNDQKDTGLNQTKVENKNGQVEMIELAELQLAANTNKENQLNKHVVNENIELKQDIQLGQEINVDMQIQNRNKSDALENKINVEDDNIMIEENKNNEQNEENIINEEIGQEVPILKENPTLEKQAEVEQVEEEVNSVQNQGKMVADKKQSEKSRPTIIKEESKTKNLDNQDFKFIVPKTAFLPKPLLIAQDPTSYKIKEEVEDDKNESATYNLIKRTLDLKPNDVKDKFKRLIRSFDSLPPRDVIPMLKELVKSGAEDWLEEVENVNGLIITKNIKHDKNVIEINGHCKVTVQTTNNKTVDLLVSEKYKELDEMRISVILKGPYGFVFTGDNIYFCLPLINDDIVQVPGVSQLKPHIPSVMDIMPIEWPTSPVTTYPTTFAYFGECGSNRLGPWTASFNFWGCITGGWTQKVHKVQDKTIQYLKSINVPTSILKVPSMRICVTAGKFKPEWNKRTEFWESMVVDAFLTFTLNSNIDMDIKNDIIKCYAAPVDADFEINTDRYKIYGSKTFSLKIRDLTADEMVQSHSQFAPSSTYCHIPEQSTYMIMKALYSRMYANTIPGEISEEFKNILRSCVQLDPELHIDAIQLIFDNKQPQKLRDIIYGLLSGRQLGNNFSIMIKKDEVVLAKKKFIGRIICPPENVLKTIAIILTTVLEEHLISLNHKGLSSFCCGNSNEMNYKLWREYCNKYPCPTIISLDGAAFDSKQFAELQEIIHNKIRELLQTDVFYGFDIFQDAFEEIMNHDHFLQYTSSNSKQFENVPDLKLHLHGTSVSGHPLKTTYENTVKAEAYAKFILKKANIAGDVMCCGDDTMVIIDRSSVLPFLQNLDCVYSPKTSLGQICKAVIMNGVEINMDAIMIFNEMGGITKATVHQLNAIIEKIPTSPCGTFCSCRFSYHGLVKDIRNMLLKNITYSVMPTQLVAESRAMAYSAWMCNHLIVNAARNVNNINKFRNKHVLEQDLFYSSITKNKIILVDDVAFTAPEILLLTILGEIAIDRQTLIFKKIPNQLYNIVKHMYLQLDDLVCDLLYCLCEIPSEEFESLGEDYSLTLDFNVEPPQFTDQIEKAIVFKREGQRLPYPNFNIKFENEIGHCVLHANGVTGLKVWTPKHMKKFSIQQMINIARKEITKEFGKGIAGECIPAQYIAPMAYDGFLFHCPQDAFEYKLKTIQLELDYESVPLESFNKKVEKFDNELEAHYRLNKLFTSIKRYYPQF